MTEKQESIVNAALELFAKDGFKATSTSKVAKLAGVSEGLIFRHFNNKDGLLDAIILHGEEKAKMLFADVVLESDPKEVIRKTLLIGEKMNKNEADAHFWKLQYKIKWELEMYGEHKVEPLERALSAAFEKLGYKEPLMEAQMLMYTFDGLSTRFYLQKDFDMEAPMAYLWKKYEL